MMSYASRTGTKRNLAALRANGWRLMVSAKGVLRTEGFPYALDNGAWTAFQQGQPFDFDAFEKAVDMLGAGADFIVAPDIVCGGMASLELSLEWVPDLLDRCGPMVLIAVQDGMTADDLRPHVNTDVGLFVGGSTEWKEQSLPMWGRLKAETGCFLHVGRVNSKRRIKLCAMAGADSFDGSGPSRFAVVIPKLTAARDQQCLTLILGAFGATLAHSIGATRVALGANLDDQADYYDCRPYFAGSLTAALQCADLDVTVWYPFAGLGKAAILQLAAAHSVDIASTFSCYTPAKGKPCGACASCCERAKALEVPE
jgi:hypothetical protein